MEKMILKFLTFLGLGKLLFQSTMFFGLLVLSIGSYALLGYIAKREEYYRWAQDVGMALNTAIAFVAVGIGLLLIATYIKNLEKKIDKV